MKTKTVALLAATGLALAACGSKTEEQPAAETNVTNIVEEPAEVTNVVTEAPAPAPADNATTAAVAPPTATLTADEQTAEDADATGMTARVDRNAPTDSAKPAQ